MASRVQKYGTYIEELKKLGDAEFRRSEISIPSDIECRLVAIGVLKRVGRGILSVNASKLKGITPEAISEAMREYWNSIRAKKNTKRRSPVSATPKGTSDQSALQAISQSLSQIDRRLMAIESAMFRAGGGVL